jgi:hypothetical protein
MQVKFFMFLVLCSAISLCGQDYQNGSVVDNPSGSVAGIVVDSDNHPMAHVKVIALAEHGAYIGADPSAVTDEDGKFRINRLLTGEHRLFPVYTEGGYPDGEAAIFRDAPSLYKSVTIEPGHTVTGVVITMPQKGARLTASIVDAETGTPVLAARIRVTNPKVPGAYIETGPNIKGVFQIVLAANMAFQIEIRAGGYERWIYSEPDNQGNPSQTVQLNQGAQKDVTVKLHKLKEQVIRKGAEAPNAP